MVDISLVTSATDVQVSDTVINVTIVPTVLKVDLATMDGITDHGALSGLADDDHTQYHTDARALVWLEALTKIAATIEWTSAGQKFSGGTDTLYSIILDAISTGGFANLVDLRADGVSIGILGLFQEFLGFVSGRGTFTGVDTNHFMLISPTGSAYTATEGHAFTGPLFLTPSAVVVSADQDNLALSQTVNLFFATTTGVDLTGFVAVNGFFAIIINIGSNTITLKHQSTASDAVNRIITKTGADYPLAANQSAMLFYEQFNARWRQIS